MSTDLINTLVPLQTVLHVESSLILIKSTFRMNILFTSKYTKVTSTGHCLRTSQQKAK